MEMARARRFRVETESRWYDRFDDARERARAIQRGRPVVVHVVDDDGDVVWSVPDLGVTADRDRKTGEIILRWSHADDGLVAHFERRFHPRDYVSDWQLSRDYRLTPAQLRALGPYAECAGYVDRWGQAKWRCWWRRARVEAVISAAPGYQPELF
jgi:hypothetical protein